MSHPGPHGLDEHGQADGPDIFAGELQRIVAHPGTRLDPLRDFRSSAHGQFHGRNPSSGHWNRKQDPVGRGMQIQRPGGLVCATIALVLGAIARTSCRGVRYVWRLRRMPRFFYPSLRSEACKSSGLGAWCVLPLRWFWALLLGLAAAVSGTFGDCAGCRGSSILLTRHSIQRLFSSRNSALQISKISRARIPSSRICCATTGGTYMTRSPSSEYITCSP